MYQCHSYALLLLLFFITLASGPGSRFHSENPAHGKAFFYENDLVICNIMVGRTHCAPYYGYGYVPLRFRVERRQENGNTSKIMQKLM